MNNYTKEIIEELKKLYPDALCSLEYGEDAWRLLVAARLSAQCTDERVNIVCRPLFEAYPDAKSMAEADIGEVERIIKPCGLYHTKAESIVKAAKIITEQYGGKVPDSLEKLLELPGVGRKIANLVLGDIYNIPGIVADTHCIRITNKLGLVDSHDPVKVERQLEGLIPRQRQTDFCHRLVHFGRDCCIARAPQCDVCVLADCCEACQKGESA